MDPSLARAAAFIKHLLSNPALNSLNPLKKEEQILQFLKTNAQSLLPTLSSRQFFPGRPWNQILQLLHAALVQESDNALKPQLEELIQRRISFAFVSQIHPDQIPEDQCSRQVWQFVQRLLEKPQTRKGLVGPVTAIVNDFVGRYLDKSFEDRQYIHFELTKVQRLRLDIRDIAHMINATLLLRPAIQLFSEARESMGELPESVLVQPQFASTALDGLNAQLPLVPTELLRGALFSNVSFEEDKQIDATARLAAIFASRGKNYKPMDRVDRGANTPDRSWFSITRRNYKYYGFDIKMLDECYKISSENGW
jgi:hypothetical protein